MLVGAMVAVAVTAGCGTASDTTETSTAQSSAVADAPAHDGADVMFAHHMIPHHQQAVEMSDVLLGKQGIDQRVTDLATQIKAAQGPEITQMQGWLTQWGVPPMPPGDMGHGDHGMPPMQGMVSEADMTALRNAQGVDAAKLFLTHMIGHHDGAITMAQSEIKDGKFPDAVTMAHTIVTTQQQEIDTMRGILATL